ncbi:putative phospholipid-transporting ATPase 5 [Smittium mucronatum]|uniref:Phospholipid-transporting ATPase n=1 Tax=Smittium mucronatum TaxID=133383 RepID=A0A1R0GWR2_9FUNG|nr:putative phospholipid-transporting ATPase 5 [Smittium mucronatum]
MSPKNNLKDHDRKSFEHDNNSSESDYDDDPETSNYENRINKLKRYGVLRTKVTKLARNFNPSAKSDLKPDGISFPLEIDLRRKSSENKRVERKPTEILIRAENIKNRPSAEDSRESLSRPSFVKPSRQSNALVPDYALDGTPGISTHLDSGSSMSRAIPLPGYFLTEESDYWTGGYVFRLRGKRPKEPILVPGSITKRVHFEISYDYPKNSISTARYNIFTFLPAQLSSQFSRIANLYFLFIAILQQIPGWSTTGRFSTFLPLSIFVFFGIAHEGYDDYRRHKMDRAENTQKSRVLKVKINKSGPKTLQTRELHARSFRSSYSNRSSTIATITRPLYFIWEWQRQMRERLVEKKRKKREQEDSDEEEEFDYDEVDRKYSSDLQAPSHPPPGILKEPTQKPPTGKLSMIFQSLSHQTSSVSHSPKNSVTEVDLDMSLDVEYPPIDTLPKLKKNKELAVMFSDEVQEHPAPDVVYSLPNNMSCRWKSKKWQDLQVGDIILIGKDEWIPADCVVLATSNRDGNCFVETSSLDGETTLKQKSAPLVTSKAIKTSENLSAFSGITYTEAPSPDLYSFEGYLEVDGEKHALTPNNLLLRGSKLRNTKFAVAQIVFSGEETRLRLNATRNIRTKSPQIQKTTNKIVIVVFSLLLCLCVVLSICAIVWQHYVLPKHWYLIGADVPIAAIIFGNIVMLNALIPISLYVTLEGVKIFQVYMMQKDIDMYYEKTDTPMSAHTTAINEDLGMVKYVLSDKTGTLTENIMRFKAVMVGGLAFYHSNGADYEFENSSQNGSFSNSTDSNTTSQGQFLSTPIPAQGSFLDEYIFSDPVPHSPITVPNSDSSLSNSTFYSNIDMDTNLCQLPPTSILRKASAIDSSQSQRLSSSGIPFMSGNVGKMAEIFLKSMALCHSVQPDIDPSTKILSGYQSTSPDEKSLVVAAAQLGYIVTERNGPSLQIRIVESSRIINWNNNLRKKGIQDDDDTPSQLKLCPAQESDIVETYQVLAVIEFSSARKRMSVVYRCPDGKIRIFCKGADSVILPRLAKAKPGDDETKWLHRCADNSLRAFACDGLRTLVYAHSEISEHEYSKWAERFIAASTSLINRQERIEQVADELERNMLLTGVTAVEDRLQEGVPETIEALRKAGIHVWMLTGDKIETAINIAKSCRLIDGDEKTCHTMVLEGIKDVSILAIELKRANSILSTLSSYETRSMAPTKKRIRWPKVFRISNKFFKVFKSLKISKGSKASGEPDVSEVALLDDSGTDDFDYSNEKIERFALVVDGDTISTLEDNPELMDKFIDVGILSDTIVCSRVSPSQKALIAKHMRIRCDSSNSYAVTVAIGDGGNDIAMIQEAHVGIGIAGVEGLQAARSSDFSIARFRFLRKLLFVHGLWSYSRISRFTLATFYKCFVFYTCQFVFQFFTGFSGTSVYESTALSMYNTLFTLLTVLVLGTLDQDLCAKRLSGSPSYYSMIGPKNHLLNKKLFFTNVFMLGLCHIAILSLGVFFIPIRLSALFTSDLFSLSTFLFTVVIVTVNAKISFIDTYTWSKFSHLAFWLSMAMWIIWNFMYNVFTKDSVKSPYFSLNAWKYMLRSSQFWLIIIIICFTALVVVLFWISISKSNDLTEIFRRRMFNIDCSGRKREVIPSNKETDESIAETIQMDCMRSEISPITARTKL